MAGDREVWELSDQELRSVSALDPGARYNYFIKRVADWQAMWFLEDRHGVVASVDAAGHLHIAVWPHPRYAEMCAFDEWEGAGPASVEVHEWMVEQASVLEAEGTMMSVFPTPDHQGYVVPPYGLVEDLRDELALYE